MRPYELMYILQPTLTAEEQTALVDRFNTLITSSEGTVESCDRCEKRNMQYEIKNFREGYYVVVNFQGTPTLVTEIDRQIRITETIIRHMILRKDD